MKHINILDPMRGLAALGVVMFHYSGSIIPTIRPNPLEDILEPARFGVQVFFVISGFIIPYAMVRSNYRVSDLGNFIYRRIIRIAPPAYVAALLVVLFHVLAVLLTGRPVNAPGWPGINVNSVLGNLTFHPALFHTQWYNFAFWSLMIEFQFYLLIGLLTPLLLDPAKRVRTTAILMAIIGAKLIDDYWFFHYAPYFVLGVAAFLLRHGAIGRIELGILTILSSVVCILDGDHVPLLFALVATAVILSGLETHWKALILLGDISYSLYITHVPIGYFTESVLKRITDVHEHVAGKLVLLFVYTAIALIGAYVFHKVIEKPFQNWSKKAKRTAKA